jgi:hypothetical protein
MTYLMTEIVLALLGAALLGFFLGWWTRERTLDRDVPPASANVQPDANPPGD